MATMNPFDLLGDDDSEDPSQLIAAQQKATPKKDPAPRQAAAQPAKPAKLPAKPLPPAQAVREARTESGHRGGRGGERGYGRGGGYSGGGFNREPTDENSYSNNGFSGAQGGTLELDSGRTSERRGGYNGPRNSLRGGRRVYGNSEVGDGERPRRLHERHSGTGRGNEIKREGSGRGNWGTASDEISQVTKEVVDESEKIVVTEKPLGEEDEKDVNQETTKNEAEIKEPEDKEMTLLEYEKVLEEKRKALQALKTEERKVDADKEFATMQALSSKKDNDDIFIKLGSDKRKELADKEEKAKKSASINEFFKPAEGEKYYSSSGRPGGRGRGSREGYTGGRGPRSSYHVEAPKIEDPGQFPALDGKVL